MVMEKLEVDTQPKAYEVLAAAVTGYRSGKRVEITVRFNWKITAVGAKYQYYTDVVVIQWDRAKESLQNLKNKATAIFNALKAADTSDADLIFALLHLTI